MRGCVRNVLCSDFPKRRLRTRTLSHGAEAKPRNAAMIFGGGQRGRLHTRRCKISAVLIRAADDARQHACNLVMRLPRWLK
jgi:hypothetical protein